MIKCAYCGKEYTPKNPKGKFCSDKCRVYWGRHSAIRVALDDPKIKQSIKETFDNHIKYGQSAVHIPSMTTGNSLEEVQNKLTHNQEIQAQIDKLTTQIQTFVGDSPLISEMKNKIQFKINQLKKQLR